MRLVITGMVYFTGVFVALGYASYRSNGYRATRELLYVVGLLFAVLPLVNFATTGDLFLTDLFSPSITYAWIDLSLLLSGFATIKAASMVPKSRPKDKLRSNRPDRAIEGNVGIKPTASN